MSNFICPHCQQIIDDGSDGFTSDREIELEKDIDRLSDRNAKLEKKLEIAVQALEKYARRNDWYNCRDEKTEDIYINSGYFLNGYETAEKALEKISEVEK